MLNIIHEFKFRNSYKSCCPSRIHSSNDQRHDTAVRLGSSTELIDELRYPSRRRRRRFTVERSRDGVVAARDRWSVHLSFLHRHTRRVRVNFVLRVFLLNRVLLAGVTGYFYPRIFLPPLPW